MQLIRRLRIPALLCALAVLGCELIARPWVSMGISDDGPFVIVARTLAATGHVAYNGWEAPMLTFQLYLAAAFIKLFGFSFTTVRMSTLLIAVVTAFVLQRALVRVRISERNATLGTLALVLSPLYLMLSVTFMSDITGLFAIVICLYCCLRALQASSARATIGWICFAVTSNVLCGTSRQIDWLGTLVMVPSTLWLLRARRRVLIVGAVTTLVGVLFIFGCMHWLKQQPYVIPVPLFVSDFPLVHTFFQLTYLLLDMPFLLLPIAVLFLPEIRKSRSRVIAVFSAALLVGIVLAAYPSHIRSSFEVLLEPTMRAGGDWVGVHGIHEGHHLQGTPPIFLNHGMQALLAILSLGGLLGLIASFLRARRAHLPVDSSTTNAWKQLAVLMAPFTAGYILLLIACAGTTYYLFDRYALGLLLVALLCLLRYYQEYIHHQLPLASVFMIAVMAIYGIVVTHNMFSLYRARVALAAELRANDIPDTSVDNGFEYNFGVELQHTDHINDPRIIVPAHAYVSVPPLPAGTCEMFWHDKAPHIHPVYGISFDPNACYGPAPFASIHYSHWLARSPGTLYVVRYIPASKP
jgi:Dolichyl-phosphate-mannose-protein mannosyltransferase